MQDLPIKGKKRSAPSTNIQNFYSIKTRLVYCNLSKVAILRWAGPNITTAFQNYSVWKHSTSSKVCVVHLGFFDLVTEVLMRISQRQCLVQRRAYKFRDQIFTLYILPPPPHPPGLSWLPFHDRFDVLLRYSRRCKGFWVLFPTVIQQVHLEKYHNMVTSRSRF